MSRSRVQQEVDVADTKGFLLKRKDFLGVDELAHSHPNRTYYYRKNQDLDDIIETCTKKLQADPRNVKALYLRGSSLVKKRGYDEGIRDFNTLLSIQPSHVDGLYNRAVALTKVDQQERAIEDLTRVLSINPDHVNAAFARAACYNKIGQFVKAIEDYNFALMKDESNTDDANLAADAALSQQGDDFSSNGGTDSSRLAYHHTDGDVSPILVPAGRRLPTSDSGGDISPLSNRSSGKFSQYHQYGSPVSTPVSRPAAAWTPRGQDASSYTYGLPPGAAAAGGGGRSVQGGPEGWATGAVAVGGSVSANNSIVGTGGGGGSVSGSVKSGTPARPTPRQPNGALNASVFSNNTIINSGSSVASGANGSTVKTFGTGPSGGSTGPGANDSAAPNIALAEEHHSRGYLLRKANNFAGAVAEYTKAIAADPRHFKALFNRGFAHDKLGHFDLAIADYSRAIEIDAQNAFCYYNRGISSDRKGALDAALADFNTAISLQPSNAEFYHNRAFCLRKLNDLEAAIADYGTSLKLSPGNFKALVNRASCYEQQGQLPLALTDCTTALAVQPTHGPCLLLRATVLERLSQLPEALSAVNTALLNGADAFAAYSLRAKVLGRMGSYADAVKDLSVALGLQPHNLGLLFSRAMCHKSLERHDLAVTDFAAVVAQDPTHVAAFNHLGYCHRKLEQYDDALRAYSRCISLAPDNVRAYNNRAFILAKLERFAEAVEDYTVVLRHEPRSVHAYHNRGISYDKMGLIDLAIADFTKVLELEPQSYVDGAGNGGSPQQRNREAAAAAVQSLQQQQLQQQMQLQQLQQLQQQQQQQPQGTGLSQPPLQPDGGVGLRNAQALLSLPQPVQSTVPAPTAAAAPTTPAPRSALSLATPATIGSTLNGAPVQGGAFYVPRGHEAVSALPLSRMPLVATVSPALAWNSGGQSGQGGQNQRVSVRAQPVPLGSTPGEGPSQAAAPSAAPAAPPAPSVDGPLADTIAPALSSNPLSNRILEVSSLLSGFNTQFQPPIGASTSSSNTNGRSTTPVSYQFARRAAQSANGSTDASGMRSTSAGVVDSSPPAAAAPSARVALPLPATPSSSTAAGGRPNLYRAPVPVPQQIPQEGESNALIPPPPSEPDSYPVSTAALRPLPAAIVPGRFARPLAATGAGDAPLSIDVTRGAPSSGDSVNSGVGSAGRGAPLSAAAYLGSLKKPAPSAGVRLSPVGGPSQDGAPLAPFSPSPALATGPVQIRGKFSNPQVYSGSS